MRTEFRTEDVLYAYWEDGKHTAYTHIVEQNDNKIESWPVRSVVKGQGDKKLAGHERREKLFESILVNETAEDDS